MKVFAAGAAEARGYDPHLSLAYGEHLARDENAVTSLLRFPVKIAIDGLSVVKTEGAVPEWQSEARYPLEGRSCVSG